MVALNTANTTLWGRHPGTRQQLVTELIEKVGVVVTRKQVLAFVESTGRTENDVTWLFNNRLFRVGRGQYTLQPMVFENGSTTVQNVA